VGGFDGQRQLSSVERFDTDNRVWETVTSMKISRSALSVNVIDAKLYAFGGYDGNHFLSNVEVYNPLEDSWEDGVPLTSGRSGLASAVIYQPSCSQHYSQENITLQHTSREYDERGSQHNSSQGGGSSSMHLRNINFNSRGFSSDNNQEDIGDQSNYCDDDVPYEDFNAIKKLKTSNENSIKLQNPVAVKTCPLQSFKSRIKHFLHNRRHPCKLKTMILNSFNS
jgi:kelch-like protein 19